MCGGLEFRHLRWIRTEYRRPCRQNCWPLAWVQQLAAGLVPPQGVQPVPTGEAHNRRR
ncbi:MAG: hypothetical protein RLZZ329_2522, partial [Pseudomonadota bacterium]